MGWHELQAALAELARRQRAAAFTPEEVLFEQQLAVIRSTATRKVLLCGRRSGKTRAAVSAMSFAAREYPAVPVLYLTLTRSNAKEIAWADLLAVNEEYRLGGVPNQTELSIRFPKTGGVIQLRGCNNDREVNKIRGKRFKLVIIDEAQSIPDRILRPLVAEIIGPTLVDYGGELWLIGTPPPVRAGYFYDCYGGKLSTTREQHRWTLKENVKLPVRMQGRSVEAILADIREENGWTEEDPTYRREYLGEDVEDLEALLFPLTERNYYDLPPMGGQWSYVVGVDIGSDDADAIAVLGWRAGDRRLYLIEEMVQAREDVTDLAAKLNVVLERYKPMRVVLDQGGLGKKLASELVRRHSLPIEAAEKSQKSAYIKLIGADIRKGNLLVPRGSVYAQDCVLVQRDPEALAKGLLQEKPTWKGGFHSDIADAVLYGWRCAMHFIDEPQPAQLTETQRMEAAEAEEARLVEEAQLAHREALWL